MEKKSERLEVRLGHQEKQEFADACDMQGDTPSGAIRRYISGYVRRSDGDVLASAWRSSAKRKATPIIATAAAVVTLASGFLFWIFTSVQPDSDAIFSFRDQNGDGELEYSEHGVPPDLNGGPNGVLRVLDLDESGTISRTEFVRNGRMVFAFEEQIMVAGNDKNKHAMTLVEFQFGKERTQSSTYADATINASGLDRLVVWPKEGPPVVMSGKVNIMTGLKNIELRSDVVTVYPDQ